MAGGVFVLKDPVTLVAMKSAHFASEDDFQKLLADFPALLGAVQGDSEEPRRWVLLSREKGIQSELGGYDRFAVDHLFIDQDGIPTLVEVKRQTDTRLRREVVGQMLDYAANAVLHWSGDKLRTEFETSCAGKGSDPHVDLADLTGPDGDVDALWKLVDTNLKAGKVRLLFVADRIPSEVKGIVEFLNKQMRPAEVLAVELQQYEGEGLRTIVPTVFGRTEEARRDKPPTALTRQWDEPSFFEELKTHVTSDLLPVAHRIVDWIKTESDEVEFGRGPKIGSVRAVFKRDHYRFVPLEISTTAGAIYVNFGYLKAPFDGEGIRQGWVNRIRAVPGLTLPPDAESRHPSISLTTLERCGNEFFEAMNWLVTQIRPSP